MARFSSFALVLVGLAWVPVSCSDSDGGSSDATSAGGTENFGGGLDFGTGGRGSGIDSTCDSLAMLDCGAQQATATTVGVSVLLVLDKSGSMGRSPEGNAGTSLWQAMRTALRTTLEEATEHVRFGLDLYPRSEDGPIGLDCAPNCCAMPESEELLVGVASGSAVRRKIVAELDASQPGGGTPTAAALERAYHYFAEGEGRELDGERFVLLATDGGPNCDEGLACDADSCTLNIDGQCPIAGNCCAANREGCLDTDGTLEQLARLQELGVDTFVIGLAGTEQYAEQLNEFAVRGGRARAGTDKYYRVEASGSTEGLIAVFSEITTKLIRSCDVKLESATSSANFMNVAVDCELIGGAAGPLGGGGEGGAGGELPVASPQESSWWLDSSTTPSVVRLQGKICERIRSDGAERIDVVQGCPSTR